MWDMRLAAPEKQPGGGAKLGGAADAAAIARLTGTRFAGRVPVQQDGFHRWAKIFRAAAMVASMSVSAWAAETKPASKAEGAR